MTAPEIRIAHRLMDGTRGEAGARIEATYGPRGNIYEAQANVLAHWDDAAGTYRPVIHRWNPDGNGGEWIAATAETIERDIARTSFVVTIPPSYRRKMAEALAEAAAVVVNMIPAEWYEAMHADRRRHAADLRSSAALLREIADELERDARAAETPAELYSWSRYYDGIRVLRDIKEGRR